MNEKTYFTTIVVLQCVYIPYWTNTPPMSPHWDCKESKNCHKFIIVIRTLTQYGLGQCDVNFCNNWKLNKESMLGQCNVNFCNNWKLNEKSNTGNIFWCLIYFIVL